jgi:CO/xanthine dehydrogenase Mo-binding subunit
MICRNVRCEAPRQRGSDGGARAGSTRSRAPSTDPASLQRCIGTGRPRRAGPGRIDFPIALSLLSLTADGIIQIYPCYAFETHIVYVEIDPETAKPVLRRYVCGHDCGVMINPDIVHGMTRGGIAHAIGAALYEKIAYTEDDQLESGTFMDYLIPSAMEIPTISIVDHCTPSPLTTFGQKGSGEAGYLGAPAAVANAIDDALAPLGVNVETLPISQDALWHAIETAKTKIATDRR